MTSNAHATFTLRSAQDKLGLSRTVLTGLIGAGFVSPSRGARNEKRFTFQDLMLLRIAHALQTSGIPPRKILKSLAKLKSELPAELPLTGLRITAIGADVAVRGRHGKLEATSGQLLMDFEVAAVGSGVAFLDRTPPQPAPAASDDPAALLRQGEAHEVAGDHAAAEAAYRQAIALSPDDADAYLNLGAMLCESERCTDAVRLYETAVLHCPESAAIWFNRAIALEDQQRVADAAISYERSLALDPALADAHYNLGRLREKVGDARGALRHFSAYRRLRT